MPLTKITGKARSPGRRGTHAHYKGEFGAGAHRPPAAEKPKSESPVPDKSKTDKPKSEPSEKHTKQPSGRSQLAALDRAIRRLSKTAVSASDWRRVADLKDKHTDLERSFKMTARQAQRHAAGKASDRANKATDKIITPNDVHTAVELHRRAAYAHHTINSASSRAADHLSAIAHLTHSDHDHSVAASAHESAAQAAERREDSSAHEYHTRKAREHARKSRDV